LYIPGIQIIYVLWSKRWSERIGVLGSCAYESVSFDVDKNEYSAVDFVGGLIDVGCAPSTLVGL
jgi:hypothetical protein